MSKVDAGVICGHHILGNFMLTKWWSSFDLSWVAWIAEWHHTQLWRSECCSLGHEFQPRLKYNKYSQRLWEEDEIKTGNTIINIIICNFFVNLCCLWKLENHENGIKHFLSPIQVRLKGWHWVDTMLQMKSSTQFMDCSSLIPLSILKGNRLLIFNCLPPVNLEI